MNEQNEQGENGLMVGDLVFVSSSPELCEEWEEEHPGAKPGDLREGCPLDDEGFVTAVEEVLLVASVKGGRKRFRTRGSDYLYPVDGKGAYWRDVRNDDMGGPGAQLPATTLEGGDPAAPTTPAPKRKRGRPRGAVQTVIPADALGETVAADGSPEIPALKSEIGASAKWEQLHMICTLLARACVRRDRDDATMLVMLVVQGEREL